MNLPRTLFAIATSFTALGSCAPPAADGSPRAAAEAARTSRLAPEDDSPRALENDTGAGGDSLDAGTREEDAGAGGESLDAGMREGDAGAAGDSLDAGLFDEDAAVDQPGASLPDGVGALDATAQRGCVLLAGTNSELVLAASPAGAARAIVAPSATRAFHVVFPPSGIGYATLEVADWHTPLALFATPGLSLQVDRAQVRQPVARDAACSGAASDARLTIHEWGSYLLRVDATVASGILAITIER